MANVILMGGRREMLWNSQLNLKRKLVSQFLEFILEMSMLTLYSFVVTGLKISVVPLLAAEWTHHRHLEYYINE